MRLITKISPLSSLLSIVTTYSGVTLIEHLTLNELEKGLYYDLNLFTLAIDRELEEKSNIIKLERKKLLTILKTIDDGLITIDPGGAITCFNR